MGEIFTTNKTRHIDSTFKVNEALHQRLNHEAILITTLSRNLHYLQLSGMQVYRDGLCTFTTPS